MVYATTDLITIQILDPCPNTYILSNPVPGFAADIGFFDQKNLFNYNWPWMDFVDQQSGQFGTDKCGLKKYFVTDLLNNPVPFMSLSSDGTLVMAPVDGRDVPGSYTCKLNSYMEEFPNIMTSSVF